MKRRIFSLAAAGLLLAGCDTYTSQQYQSSPANTIALQSVAAAGKRASVGSVSSTNDVNINPTCRLAGPLDIGGGQDVTTAVKQAFQAEFLAGNIYSTRGTPIDVKLTELKPDSVGGKWTIGLNVASRKGTSYNVRTVYNFKTSFSALAACNNTADAFNRALAQSINDVVANPQFRSLL